MPKRKTAAELAEEAKWGASIEARGGRLRPDKTWKKRPAHIRAHEAVAACSAILTVIANGEAVDLDEWTRWQMPESLADLRSWISKVEQRLGSVSQVAVTPGTEPRTCAACDKPMVTVRSDAVYCSAACRQRAYRLRGANPGSQA